VGKLGDDEEGRYCLQRLRDFGVPLEFVDIIPGGKTPVAYVFITAGSGARSIIYERNALPKIEMDPKIESLARRAEVVLLDPEVTYLGGDLKNNAGQSVSIVYDCERWRPGIKDIMRTANYFIPSSEFLAAAELDNHGLGFNQKIIQLNTAIAGTLIVTDGEAGAYYIADHALYRVPVPDVRAIDTVGAGDNFHAAFALAISRKFDLHRAVILAVAVASLSCRKYGGRNGLPTWKEALSVAGTLTPERIAALADG
jgi:sulfofructose kinase